LSLRFLCIHKLERIQFGRPVADATSGHTPHIYSDAHPTWIIHKSWMMHSGFRLFLKNSVLKPEIQNTLLHKSREVFWANL
jgi:hypothetical protein